MNGILTRGNARVTKPDGGSLSPVPSRSPALFGLRPRSAAIGLWLALLFIGFALIHQRSLSPGQTSKPPERWPEQSILERSTMLPTLVMMVHPQCACSASSLAELAHVLARCEGHVKAHVVMLYPAGSRQRWGSTDLWRQAATIPGATLHADVGAQEARLFHSFTSGDVIVYSKDGELLFHGGITPARNHSGDSEGREAVRRLLLHGTRQLRHSPVFGCPLFRGRPNGGGEGDEWQL